MLITANYINGYPMPYNSVSAVAAGAGTEYSYQPPVHMIPTYYPPGQPALQAPPPVMWRVPTPPNTPTSNQVGLQMSAGVPLMYVNSGSYAAPPAIVSTTTFGHHNPHHPHQIAGTGSGASPAPPPGAYMTSAIVPNLVFRQNVPVRFSYHLLWVVDYDVGKEKKMENGDCLIARGWNFSLNGTFRS